MSDVHFFNSTGFRDQSSSGSREGTFHPAIPLPEGGVDADIARIETALLVTADIGQPLGLSERRLGAGFLPGGPIAQVRTDNASAPRPVRPVQPDAVSPVSAGTVQETGG